MARALETGMRVFDELREGVDPEEAIARRRDELRSLLAPIDAVHLLGHLAMWEAILDPDTYAESEHPGAAYVVELVAAVLLERPDRSGERAQTPAIDAHVLEPARTLASEAASLESLRRYLRAGGWGSAEGAARGRAATAYLYLRSPGWWWQEHETLRGLFGEGRFAEQLRAELGFDAEDGIRCSEAVQLLVGRRVGEHMRGAREQSASFGPGHPAYRWAESAFDGRWKRDPANAARYIPFVWALNHLGDALLIAPADLADAAEVEEAAAASFLGSLAIGFGQQESDWFRLAEHVRNRPFIELGASAYLPTVAGADLWALRGLFESVLKSSESYLTRRGRWLEQRVAQLLETALAPDEVHRSLRYELEEEDGSTPEGEIDVLLRCGTSAVVVEAKSATMRPGARRGGEALIKHLEANLTKAAEQGSRAKRALGGGGTLRVRGGRQIELGEAVQEMHPVLVTLDDLSAVAPVLWELHGTDVVPEQITMPWVITLHELEQVVETVEWPVQLLHFLRRRSRLNEIGKYVASDELDWWMHYLRFGLYFEEEDEPAGRVRVTSLTDPLDAWMLHERGIREAPAPKPAMKLPKGSHEFIAKLCEERPDGWVHAACTLLESDTEAQARFWKELKKLRRDARSRGKVQRMTLGFSEGPQPMLICAAAVPDDGKPMLLDSLRALVSERIVEHGSQRVLAIGSLVSSKRPYDALVVLEPTQAS